MEDSSWKKLAKQGGNTVCVYLEVELYLKYTYFIQAGVEARTTFSFSIHGQTPSSVHTLFSIISFQHMVLLEGKWVVTISVQTELEPRVILQLSKTGETRVRL